MRAAIQAANALGGADEISLPSNPRPYLLTMVTELTITDSLTITGGGASTTIIDGNKSVRPTSGVLLIPNGGLFVNISGVTIQNGAAADAVGVGGGGIFNGGTLTLTNSTVNGNSSGRSGGGIRNNGALTMTNSTVSGNFANVGGGIINFGALTMTNSTVSGNFANIGGGGILNVDTLTMTNSTVSGNNANQYGGGIYNNNDPSVVTGTANVFNSTITNNQADADLNGSGTGGGIFNAPGATFNFQNTILARNRETAFLFGFWLPVDADCAGTINSNGNNIIWSASCTIIGSYTPADPLLGPLASNGGPTRTHAPLNGSPAIDAGNPGGCALLLRDQRGSPRAVDGDGNGTVICDIGAYELNPGPTTIVAAVLPLSRSHQFGTLLTAFAAIINTGPADAANCRVQPPASPPAGLGPFIYQTTDPATNLPTGTPNTPATILPSALQTFVFGVTPTAAIPETSLAMRFQCDNADAPQIVGVNNLILVTDAMPVPDTIALISTISGDGVVHIPGSGGVQLFAIGTSNVGATGVLTVSADTGGVALPLTLTVCETSPMTGVCLAPPTPTVTVNYLAGTNRSFAFFAQASGSIVFSPGVNRVFPRLTQGLVTRGATSTAVCTTPNAGC